MAQLIGETIKTMFRPITDEDIKNAPTDEWVCEVCGSVNTNWRVSGLWVLGKNVEKYKPGECRECRRRQEEKERQEQEAEIRRRMKIKTEYLLEQSNIPNQMKKVTFDILEVNEGNAKAVAVMRKIDKADRWIYLWGESSVGKSWLLGASINYLAQKGIPSIYLNEAIFFEKLKGNFEGVSEMMHLFNDAHVVFWDEFSLRKYINNPRVEWKYDIIYSLIEYLSENEKVVVFTSNISPENDFEILEKRVGKRIVARLKRNKVYVVHLENKPFY